MTRSMVVTVLHRLEGTPDATGNTSFDDLNSGWYSEAVDWAVEAGITTGNGNGSFLPDESITRESLAVMLYRYANTLGLNTKTTGALDDRFQDAGNVSDWAKDAMAWAAEQGILQGSNDQLRPNDDTSRAEVATMLMRFPPPTPDQTADLADYPPPLRPQSPRFRKPAGSLSVEKVTEIMSNAMPFCGLRRPRPFIVPRGS